MVEVKPSSATDVPYSMDAYVLYGFPYRLDILIVA